MEIDQAREFYRKGFRAASLLTSLIEDIDSSDLGQKEAMNLRISLAKIVALIELEFGSKMKANFPEIQEEVDRELSEYGELQD